MRPHTSLAAVGLTAALTFTLAGCFAPSPSAPTTEESTPPTESAPPAISVEPATGDLITGTGYSLNAPEGWAVPSNAPPQADVFIAAGVSDDVGFIDNVNVLLGPEITETPEEIETNGVAYLEQVVGATDVQVRPRVSIGGFESVHLAAQLSRNGVTYRTEQFFATDAGVGYTITFSFSETSSQEDREALAESVLVTWAWA
jgi:hypothetical protein